ncbi:MAG: ATP-binding protein [Bacteroidia bacterium]
MMLIGPRQVGKTTLIKSVLGEDEYLFLDGDDPTTRTVLTNPNTEQLKRLIGSHKTVFIDEAQRIENIGLTLKIIVDQLKTVQLLVSGSSAFELQNHLNEPLTGRKWEYLLYPISWNELESHFGYLKAKQQLETRILYGMYPEVINSVGDEYDVLKNLSGSYLYKDVLALGNIRKPEVLESLLKALALQIGSEVSYNELAQTVGVDKNTVNEYITLLEQSFIIFKLGSFSRNLRNELKRSKKIFFYDTGIRNMIIGNFNSLELRSDKGALFENFLISERLKKNAYTSPNTQMYFWRTTRQQEIDLVEINGEEISAFEFKWNPKKKSKAPKTFVDAYNSSFSVVTSENFQDFIY